MYSARYVSVIAANLEWDEGSEPHNPQFPMCETECLCRSWYAAFAIV